MYILYTCYTGSQTGLIEYLEGTKSIDRIKKSYIPTTDHTNTNINIVLPTLKDYFEFTFGPSYTFIYSQAIQNFMKSLVGYSLVTYVLQVRSLLVYCICICILYIYDCVLT